MYLPKFITDPNPEIYLSDNYLVLDLETTNYDHGVARNSNNTIIFGYASSPRGGKFRFNSLADLLDMDINWGKCDFIVCQNAKFELKWLIRAGVDVSKILVYDTMLGDYVRAGNRGAKEHPDKRHWRLDLDSICRRYEVKTKESYVHSLIANGVCPSTIPLADLQAYCKTDVEITHQVFLKQRKVLKEQGLLPVFFLRCLTTPVLADMEMKGMYVDKELVEKISLELNTEYNGITRELDTITNGINMASSQQVSDFLFNTLGFSIPKDYRGNPILGKPTKNWPEGQPKTNEEAIALLKPKNQTQERFVELKKQESKLRKKITTYVHLFEEACKADCILHGDFNQTIVGTQRLSSSHPNLQNIDRGLKKVVMARKKGWKILSCDEAGIEFRVGGILSQDPQILDDIINKADVHSYTASIIFEKEWLGAGATKKTTEGKALRYSAKQFTFGPMYGKVRGTPAQVKYFDAFRSKYQTMTDMQQGWVDEVLESPDNSLTTVTGLKFYFPGTQYTSNGYVTNSTNIKNYPIQMFATADISPTGVALWWHHMKSLELQSFLIAQVHDSGVAETHPDEIEIVKEVADRCMTVEVVDFLKKVIKFKINYPLETEIDVCEHWDWTEEVE